MTAAAESRGERIGWAATAACLLEVSSEKPGNVTPTYDFADMSYVDFLLSAAAVGPVLARAGELAAGALVRAGVQQTRRAAGANTNLGVLLLLAPLARAYAARTTAPPTSLPELRQALCEVLGALDLADAEAAYEAIRLARPGGLGKAEHDVAEAPRVTLREAMASAADRDVIAREYVTDYDRTFTIGVPALRAALAEGQAPRQAVLACFLALLASTPDTLISRKLGPAVAEQVRGEAAAIVALGGTLRPEGLGALAELTGRLRDAHNRLNPGATADLTAAALFCHLLLTGPEASRGGAYESIRG